MKYAVPNIKGNSQQEVRVEAEFHTFNEDEIMKREGTYDSDVIT